jgi:ankyrin repeat protein
MVESIIKQHPELLDEDVAPGWGSPLIFAITKNPDCLSILLKLGVNLNKLSSIDPKVFVLDGSYAPISWAAVTGSEVAVDFLLSQTKVNLPNDILHMAVWMQDPSHKSIRKFRQRGADVNFTVNGSTPIHDFLLATGSDEKLPVVKALVDPFCIPFCDLSLQDWTARTVLHIALDKRLEDVVIYLLEQKAKLSATATLHPNMWSWATSKPWFSKVQAAVPAPDRQRARIEGKVVGAALGPMIIEFPFAVTADHDDHNPIRAVVVSAILNSELFGK